MIRRGHFGHHVTMRTRFATVSVVAALALAACGSDEEQASEAQRPSGGGQPPPQQVQPPAEPTDEQLTSDEQLTGEEFVRESEAVAETVARAARRLDEDPRAEVSDELARAERRARSLAEQAEQPEQEGREFGEEGVQELGDEARLGLLRLNARTEVAAQRLRLNRAQEGSEEQIRQVARQEIRRLRDELEILRDAVPRDVRDSVDQLRDRLRELSR